MTQREEWMDALQYHEREVHRLLLAIRELDAASGQPLEPAPESGDRTRQIEYSTAQMIRHEISMALLSSRLATPLAS